MSAPERDNNSVDKKNIRSIEQMVEDLEKNGYEIVDLTDTDYTTELNVKVINYVSSDSFPPGKRKITKMTQKSLFQQRSEVLKRIAAINQKESAGNRTIPIRPFYCQEQKNMNPEKK